MRNISFALTTEQIRRQTKTVTRRVGWTFLKVGDLLQPVVKAQGIKKGAHVEKIGGPIRVEQVSREWMSDFVNRPDANTECIREGFPAMTPRDFNTFFRQSHPDPSADDLLVTRIKFSYVDSEAARAVE
jgi:hypothetical protein